MTRRKMLRATLIAALLAATAGVAPAANPPQELKWAELVPVGVPAPPANNKTFFAGSQAARTMAVRHRLRCPKATSCR